MCLDAGRRLRAGRDYLYVARAYGRAVERAGGSPVLLTPETRVETFERFDGIIITGGDDLPTSFSAPEPGPALGAPEDPQRIAWDRRLLDGLLGRRPVLGICYGMQLLNLHLGGTLYRSLAESVPGALDHGGGGRLTTHRARRLVADPSLGTLPEEFSINSCHGQAVASLAQGLRATARSEDGVIEAYAGAGAVGIEWHPETDPTSATIFDAFVAAC